MEAETSIFPSNLTAIASPKTSRRVIKFYEAAATSFDKIGFLWYATPSKMLAGWIETRYSQP
ncbi:hypothetical protein [Geitlerinema sp. PCC 9228]|uniref:hypothetical protein n=1 Tax=Geitlerinema sp. PCC 9228 TaxID=111611 RepID=UPI001114C6CA|nr:hypothetical protein [Geitlerinema sp. PCC 9228]